MDKVKKWLSLLSILLCFSLSLSISEPVNAVTSAAYHQYGYVAKDNQGNVISSCMPTWTSSKCSFTAYAFYYLESVYNANNPTTHVSPNDEFTITIPFLGESSKYINGIVSDDPTLFSVDNFSIIDRSAYNLNYSYSTHYPQYEIYDYTCNNVTCTTDYTGYIEGSDEEEYNQMYYFDSMQGSLVVIHGHFVKEYNFDNRPTFKFKLATFPPVGSNTTWQMAGGMVQMGGSWDPTTAQLDTIIELLGGINLNGLVAAEQATTNAVNNPEYIQQEKQDLQDAKDDAEDSADDSQDDVDASTSSLLAVLSNFLGVLTSVTPSNCYLDGSLFPHLNLGQLNLCENAPPPAITALGSLLLIAFVIPLVYNTIKMIINLFSEFQR